MKTTDTTVPKYLFHEGTNYTSYEYLGVHMHGLDDGGLMYTFRTWAPSCDYVGLVSDFTGWDSPLSLTRVSDGGIWEVHLREQKSLARSKYKFLIKSGHAFCMKGDPYAFEYEGSKGGASIVPTDTQYAFSDENWLDYRRSAIAPRDGISLPLCVNIYEIDDSLYYQGEDEHTYDSLSETLIPHLKYMGYTHVLIRQFGEDAFFAPDASLGDRDSLRRFVDRLHRNGVGVIMKAAPACIGSTHYGLREYDLSTCYEISREKPRFDIGKRDVKSFVFSCVEFWIREYHADGIYIESGLFGDHAEVLRKLQERLRAEFPDVLFILDCRTSSEEIFKKRGDRDAQKGNEETQNAGEEKREEVQAIMLADHQRGIGIPRILNKRGKLDLLERWLDFNEQDDSVEIRRIKCILQMAWPGKKISQCGCEYGKGMRGFDTVAVPCVLPAGTQRDYFEFFAALGRLYISSPELWRLDFSAAGFKLHSQSRAKVILFSRYDGKGGELIVAASLEREGRVTVKIPVENAGHFRLVFTSDGYCNSMASELDSIVEKGIGYVEFSIPPMSAAIFLRDSGNFRVRI